MSSMYDEQGQHLSYLQQMRPELKGLHYVNLLRVSTDEQAETASPDDQRAAMDGFGALNEMIYVADVWGEGISPTSIFGRDDLDEILKIADERRVDAVLVWDTSKFSRAGIDDSIEQRKVFRDRKIEIIPITRPRRTGPDGELLEAVESDANALSARATALASTRGLAASINRGQRPSSPSPVYGLAWEYRGPNGHPRCRVHWDGRDQVITDPEIGREISRRTRPAVRKGPRNLREPGNAGQPWRGYRRQADETVVPVFGDAGQVEILRRMLSRYFCETAGCAKIACELDEEKVPSPTGGS